MPAATTAKTSPITAIQQLGQSTWLDYMSREFLDNGELAALIRDDNLQGITSNPTIFEKAMSQGTAYDAQMRALLKTGADAFAIYDELTRADIQRALDMLRPTYDATRGEHGYVSLEVNPLWAFDTDKTINEAKRLWKALDRPNAMIKIPGTPEGLPAIEECLFSGININVTLLFSVEAYEKVARTYVAALRRRSSAGHGVDRVASVASFFVSRIDAEIDKQIETKSAQFEEPEQRARLSALRGKIAIANAKNAYAVFQDVFGGPEFAAPRSQGARVQRVLWASVGVKNPDYPDTLYVDELIGPDTVSTMPPETFDAVRDHGKVRSSLLEGMDQARGQIEALAAFGIDFKAATDKLLKVGVERFSKDFEALLANLQKKIDRV
jgi:transaldolase/glucose-6-phosphate isomerase